MSRTDLRVLTYNVQSPEHGDWPRRRELIQAGLAELDPDVVLLQEDTGDVLGADTGADCGFLVGSSGDEVSRESH